MKKVIFLFGHRAQFGKDSGCDIASKILFDNSVSYIRTSFAKKLKKQVAERYDLDFARMEKDDYKKSKPEHLNGLTVRDVLIKEGTLARQIWGDVWTSSAYNEILNSNIPVGLISDLRYPNEFENFDKIYNRWSQKNNCDQSLKPLLIKVLVHRENGEFKSDGSDDQLPDVGGECWDETVLNNIEDGEWYKNLVDQIKPIVIENLEKTGILHSLSYKEV